MRAEILFPETVWQDTAEDMNGIIRCELTFSFILPVNRSLEAQRKSMGNTQIDELLLQNGCSTTATTSTTTIKPLQSFPVLPVAESLSLLKHYLFAKISFK